MLELVLQDLVRERGALCSSLRLATTMSPRSDFVDCWNILDEIAEHDRRIEALNKILAEVEPEPSTGPPPLKT